MDPSVRDDGDPEPDLQLASDRAADEAAPDESAQRRPRSNGGSVRERLLARAEAARRDAEGPVRGGLDEIGKSDDGDLGGELDSLGLPSGRAPSAPLGPRDQAQLSPNLIAVFGTLIGIATVLSIIALMINIDRHKANALGKPAPVESTSVVAAPAEAPPVPKRERHKLPGPWRIADAKGDPKTRFVEGKIGTDAFIKALTNAGAEEKEAYRVLTAMKGVRDFDKCNKSDRFALLIERGSSRLKAFEYTVGPEEIYQAREGDDGLLKGLKLDLKVEHNQITGAVVYDGHDFDASAARAGFDPGLGHVVALALQGHMSLDELERGDTLRLVAQEVTVLGDFARYAGIEAIEVRHASGAAGATSTRAPFRVYDFDDPSLKGYCDANGKSPSEGGWRKPIPGAAVTSPFNPKRMHPILHKVMAHLGTDIGAPIGTPVGAAAPGTVSYVGPGGAAGNLLKIMHADGIETGYAHLSRYADGIKVGDKVKRMQIIGFVGSTGRSTGPHLHFSAQRDGKFFDAETLNLDGTRVLDQNQREQFATVVAKYDPLLDAIPLPPPLPALPSANVASAASEGSSVASSTNGAVQDPSLSEPVEDDEPSAKPSASGVAAAAPPPAAATAAPASTGSGKSGSIYMSDKELLKAQSATDEGEVEE